MHPDGDGIEDERAMAVPFGAFDPAHRVGIRAGAELAARYPTKVVGDDIVVANAATFAVNAVKKLNEFDDFDFKPGFLLNFARDSVVSASPTSSTPPGSVQWPLSGSLPRRTSSTRPS